MRKTEYVIRKTLQRKEVSLPSGLEGFAYHMRSLHALTPTETEIAIAAYRQNVPLSVLKLHPHFAAKLKAEDQAVFHESKTQAPVDSYRLLFGNAPDIEMFVSLGHHPLILRWIQSFDLMFQDLALPLEDFFNEALQFFLPEQVRTYLPSPDHPSFEIWASRKLFWRFYDMTNKRARQLRSLGADGKAGRVAAYSFKDTHRQTILSLDAPVIVFDDDEIPLGETIQSKAAEPGIEHTASMLRLFTLAGLSKEERSVLLAIGVYEYTTLEVAAAFQKTDRTIRNYKERAIAKLLRIGDAQTIAAILRGEDDLPREELQPQQARGSQKQEKRLPHCLHCGTELPVKGGNGRMKKYCNEVCRNTEYRITHETNTPTRRGNRLTSQQASTRIFEKPTRRDGGAP